MSSTQPMSRRRFLAVVGGTGGALGVAGLGGWRLLGGGEGSGPAAGGFAVDPGVEIVEVEPGFADATVWNDELLTLRAATDGSGIVLRSETTDTDHPVDAPDGFAARCVGVIDDTIVIGGHRNVEFARTAFESGIEYETLLRSAGPQAQTLLDQPSRPIAYPHEHVSIGRSATVTHTNDLEAWRNQTINMSDGTGASVATIFPSSVTFALERYSDPEHADSVYEVALVNFNPAEFKSTSTGISLVVNDAHPSFRIDHGSVWGSATGFGTDLIVVGDRSGMTCYSDLGQRVFVLDDGSYLLGIHATDNLVRATVYNPNNEHEVREFDNTGAEIERYPASGAVIHQAKADIILAASLGKKAAIL